MLSFVDLMLYMQLFYKRPQCFTQRESGFVGTAALMRPYRGPEYIVICVPEWCTEFSYTMYGKEH